MMIQRTSLDFKTMGGQQGRCRITYDPYTDPYAIKFYFVEGDTTWVFGRDLLREVVKDGHSGEGDVQFVVDGEHVIMMLGSPEGSAEFIFDKVGILLLVQSIYHVLPFGSESSIVDWEQEIAKILA